MLTIRYISHASRAALSLVIVFTFVFSPLAPLAGLPNVGQAEAANFSASHLDATSFVAGATSTYIFSFTTVNEVPAAPGAILAMQFPEWFIGSGLENVTLTVDGEEQVLDETSSYSNEYLIARLESIVAAESEVEVTIANVQNASTSGSYNFRVDPHTRDTEGSLIDKRATGSPIVLTADPDTLFAGGNGDDEPWEIETCEQLQNIGYDATTLAGNYVLVDDVICTETEEWNPNGDEWIDGEVGGTIIPDSYNDDYPDRVADVINNGYYGFEPIGTFDATFTGTFDGQGNTISDLWIFRKDNEGIGLFGLVVGATISNVTLLNAKVVGGTHTGGLIGYASGSTLSDIRVENSMVRAYLALYGGGIAGRLGSNSMATDVEVNSGFVHGSGNIIGGLFGVVADGSGVTNATSSADVDGGERVGGAVGSLEIGSLNNVHASGDVIGTLVEPIKSGTQIGGLVGYATGESSIDRSSASGDVTSESDLVGGFVGEANGDVVIQYSFATGDVVTDSISVGGFAGALSGGATVRQSYASGEVFGQENVGGFVGYLFSGSEIYNSFATGAVTGWEEAENVGGFAGSIDNGGVYFTYAAGDVASGDESTNVGGFAGKHVNAPASLHSSFSTGDVFPGMSSTKVGHFIGLNDNASQTNNGYVTNNVPSAFGAIGLDIVGIGETTGVSIDHEVANVLAFYDPLHTLYTAEVGPYEGYDSWDFGSVWAVQCDALPLLRFDANPQTNCGDGDDGDDEGQGGGGNSGGSGGGATATRIARTLATNLPTANIASLIAQIHSLINQYKANGGELSPVMQSFLSLYPTANLNNEVRDLEYGMDGEDVRSLQHLLIGQGQSIPAGATGWFGPETRAALAAYQVKNSIIPAAGYFGPITRAFMKAAGISGLWW